MHAIPLSEAACLCGITSWEPPKLLPPWGLGYLRELVLPLITILGEEAASCAIRAWPTAAAQRKPRSHLTQQEPEACRGQQIHSLPLWQSPGEEPGLLRLAGVFLWQLPGLGCKLLALLRQSR